MPPHTAAEWGAPSVQSFLLLQTPPRALTCPRLSYQVLS